MTNKAKQKNEPSVVAFYNTQPGNEAGLLFYDAPEPTRSTMAPHRMANPI